VAQGGTGLRVKWEVQHPAPEQLQAELVNAATGVTVDVTALGRADGQAWVADGVVDALGAANAAGPWVLRFRDTVPGAEGVLVDAKAAPAVTVATAVRFAEAMAPVTVPDSDPAKGGAVAEGATVQAWHGVTVETFEGVFPSPGWLVSDQHPDGCTYLWDDNGFRAMAPSSWAAWPADDGADALNPATSRYAPSMDSWMVYGPFSLAGEATGRVAFDAWLDIESYFDALGVFVSRDGSAFDPVAVYSTRDVQWSHKIADIGTAAGDSSVWVAFRFASDSSVQYGGPWLDNIVIQSGDGRVLVPLVRR
jgi:hypothetical protein